MKKSTLIKLHLYSGLFTCFYLLALGFSSIVLNHRIDLEHDRVTATWTETVEVDTSLTDGKLAESIRDQLAIMGWVPGWLSRREGSRFTFQVTHLAKTSELTVLLDEGTATVAEKPKGLPAAFHGLHFFNGRIPNAPFFLKTWIVYQWLALFVLFISLVLGLWLWIKYSYRSWELWVFGSLFLLSMVLMALV